MPEPLAAEALQSTKRSTCGSLSLFDFEPGQYECSMGKNPVASSKTKSKPSAAGSIWRGGAAQRVSFRMNAEANDAKLAPTTTADTTAELGCKPWHCAVACECRLIRPAADRGCVFLRCRNHAVTMAHRAGGCHTPWAVFLPYRLDGSPCFFINLIDKLPSHRHSCRAVAGKHHSDFRREKTRKEAAIDACPFRVFQNSRLFNSRRLFG